MMVKDCETGVNGQSRGVISVVQPKAETLLDEQSEAVT